MTVSMLFKEFAEYKLETFLSCRDVLGVGLHNKTAGDQKPR